MSNGRVNLAQTANILHLIPGSLFLDDYSVKVMAESSTGVMVNIEADPFPLSVHLEMEKPASRLIYFLMVCNGVGLP